MVTICMLAICIVFTIVFCVSYYGHLYCKFTYHKVEIFCKQSDCCIVYTIKTYCIIILQMNRTFNQKTVKITRILLILDLQQKYLI